LHKSLRVADLAYFSLNVVTSVGLTNVIPVSRTAQMMVMLQEFAAVFYMAFVIARLVGMCSSMPTATSGNTNDDDGTPKQATECVA
jgi:hypothetical protein